MVDQNFVVNIDRLKKSKESKVKIDLKVLSSALDLDDPEIAFEHPIQIKGELYIADDKLVMHFDVETIAITNCTICNGDAPSHININNFYHIEDLKDLKKPHYDFSSLIREEILIETPRYAECSGGNCPEREIIKCYLGRNQS